MNIWTKVVKETPNVSSKKKLRLIGTTRWSVKQEAISGIMGSTTSLIVLIKSLSEVCRLPNFNGDALKNACDNFYSWTDFENIVNAFILHEIFLLISPTTKYLQKSGLNLIDAIQALQQSNNRLEDCKDELSEYISKAEYFVEETNHLMETDRQMVHTIRIPNDRERQTIYDQIVLEFQSFLQSLIEATNDRILTVFSQTDNIYHEMKFLDLEFIRNHLSDNTPISLKKLCERTDVDESLTVAELLELVSTFSQYQNRPEYVSALNNNNYDEDENDEINLIIENEDDVDETNVDMENENVHIIPLQANHCCCLECILNFISQTEEQKLKFENILKVYKYIAVLPSTQNKCERDFSKLKLIKTRLR